MLTKEKEFARNRTVRFNIDVIPFQYCLQYTSTGVFLLDRHILWYNKFNEIIVRV